jgi:cytochrome P450
LETSFHLPAAAREEYADLLNILGRWFVMRDGTEHRSARSRVGSLFAPARLRKIHGALEDVIRKSVEEYVLGGGGDAVRGVANVVSARTIALLVGLPNTDVSELHRWARAIADFVAASYRANLAKAAQEAIREIGEALAGSVTARDVWQQAADNDEERLATCSMLLFGGLETTSSLIGMSIWYALQNGLLPRLVNLDEAEDVVERTLSFRPPLGHVARAAATDLEVDGCLIPAGDPVLVSLTGVDPMTVTSPPHLAPAHVVTDRRIGHLAFGFGVHYCIGAALTRLEASLTLRQLALSCPEAKLGPFSWSKNRTYRGLSELTLRVSPPIARETA